MSTVAAACPGTCGELFQGTLDGVPCLVSCPIDRYARIRVTARPGEGLSLPGEMSKTRRALENFLERRPLAGRNLVVERLDALPEGKGYASSTADILSALACAATLAGISLPPEEASSIALSVEPTDSIAWPGLALLDHREGRIMRFLGPPPPLTVLVLDWGGTVDTEEFNSRDSRPVLSSLAALHREAFSLVLRGVEQGDPETLGRGASMSARAAARLLDKPRLDECFALCSLLEGHGVCVAHSGTLYGILLPSGAAGREGDILETAARRLSPGWEGKVHSLVPGGPRTEERKKSP
jgi:L-threonine kinase